MRLMPERRGSSAGRVVWQASGGPSRAAHPVPQPETIPVANSPDDLHPSNADEALSELGDEATSGSGARPEPSAALVAQLRQELDQANERALRAHAEFENLRRRLQREMQEERKFANQPLILDLLPALDNMHRAIQAAQQSSDGSGLLEGVKMVQQLLVSVLEKHHCSIVPAAGEVFDPTRHEALVQMPSSEFEAGRVSLVSQQGYQLHDRVIRPAQVVVSAGPPAS